MPGCLGLDAMWQLVGFFLGWLGEPGKGRALGVNNVKFSGEVLNEIKQAIYEINVKRILKKSSSIDNYINHISIICENSYFKKKNQIFDIPLSHIYINIQKYIYNKDPSISLVVEKVNNIFIWQYSIYLF